MAHTENFKVYLLQLILVILLVGCFDKPDEFIGPTWDTKVNFPVTTKEFELLEIVEKDSSILKSSQDPSTLGLIYFGDTQSVSTITIEDELKLDPFETNFSQSIGSIEINIPLPVESEIGLEDWAPGATGGSLQIFPEQEGNVNIDITGVETVESMEVEEGNLTFRVWNNLPVEIVLRGIRIQNKIDGSVIAERSGDNPSNWITIPGSQFRSIVFPVEGKTITNSLEYIGTIWTAGSNGIPVQIPEESEIIVLALFEDLVISAATAPLPVQTFNFNQSLVIDDSTEIEEAIIDQGSAILTANNEMDVSLTADVKFENLFDSDGKLYELSIPLARNEKNKIIDLSNLNGWKVTSASPGVTTDRITYSVEVVTDSTGEVSTIAKNDSVTFKLNFNELVFSSFTGLLKPADIDIEETGFKLDYGDFNEQLEYGEINFKDATFNLNFGSSADIKLLLNGDLFGTNGTSSNFQNTGDIIIPADEPVEIDISDLINGFSDALPDSFSMIGSALLNPYYEVGQVSRGDSVYGTIDFEIPLNVGISAGSFKDTFDVDLGDVDKDDINRLNYGEVSFTIRNTVPVALTFTAMILDSMYNEVLALPIEENNIDYIEVPKPVVSSDGEILSAGEIVQTIILFGDDIKKFLDNPYISVQFNFKTAGDEIAPVKFKTSNKISFDVKAKAEYKVEL